MPKFSDRSKRRLQTCHPDLVRVMNSLVKLQDTIILAGVRTVAEQEENVDRGVSKTMDSRHLPGGGLQAETEHPDKSYAVDAAPYFKDTPHVKWPRIGTLLKALPAELRPELWQLLKWYHWAGSAVGIGHEQGVDVQWGGNWNGDDRLDDQRFFDLPHLAIRRKK